MQDAQFAARLRHPNLVRVYDVGHEKDQYFIVMEFLDGITFDIYIRENRPIPLKTFFRIFCALAKALGEAHKHNIIHRDVKPTNIIIVQGQKPVLTDFGIGTILHPDDRLTVPGQIIGTPAYMAPEQVQGNQRQDGSSDVYSLGMMMYEVLAKHLPQKAENVFELLNKRINEDIPPLEQTNPRVPAPLSKIVMRSVARDLNIRYRNGMELARSLVDAYNQIFKRKITEPETGVFKRPLAFDYRTVIFPAKDSDPIVSGVDTRYTDIQAIISAVENSPTGYGVVSLHYEKHADVLMFAKKTLAGAFRFKDYKFSKTTLDDVLARPLKEKEGTIDSCSISEDYYTALKVMLNSRPTIKGTTLAFVNIIMLLNYLGESEKSGFLRFQSEKALAWISVSEGYPMNFFGGELFDDGKMDDGSLEPLYKLQNDTKIRVDFYSSEEDQV